MVGPAQPLPPRPVCQVPPHGWQCSRTAGHDGPCAAEAVPTAACRTGDRVRIASGTEGTVISGGWSWRKRTDGVRVLLDSETEGRLYWPEQLEMVAQSPAVEALATMDNEIWWAKLWIKKATPGEIAAMRALLAEGVGQ